MTAPDLLARAFALPTPEGLEALPEDSRCALTGAPIAEGVPVGAVVKPTQKSVQTLYHGPPRGHVSAAAAACYAAATQVGSTRLAFLVVGGDGWHPAITAATAEKTGRPTWRDAIRSIWPARRGEPFACMLVTDTHPLNWPYVECGTLGGATPVFINDGPVRETRYLDWPVLLEVLDLVEWAYGLGLAKAAIRDGIMQAPAAREMPLAEAWALERELAAVRHRPEFGPALLVAQKEETA